MLRKGDQYNFLALVSLEPDPIWVHTKILRITLSIFLLKNLLRR
jgi:hypothetical protein